MYFLLPYSRTGLDELINNITPGRVHSLMQTMKPATINLTIPRFDFSYSVGLKSVLENVSILFYTYNVFYTKNVKSLIW